MVNTRWFAYALLLAAAFAIGLLGTISASRALAPPAPQTGPTLTTPTSTTNTPAGRTIEC